MTPTHFNEVSNAVFSAVFLLRGMASAMGRIDALIYWVVSDHFEELGRPPALMHGGFGLRTVGELRKPRWWALALLERLGETRLPVAYAGDGGGSLVEAVAARGSDGAIGVLTWNLTLDQSKAAGDPALDREVTVVVDGLQPGAAYTLTHLRVDEEHSDIGTVWWRMRRADQDWPDDEQWQQLRAADRLDEGEPAAGGRGRRGQHGGRAADAGDGAAAADSRLSVSRWCVRRGPRRLPRRPARRRTRCRPSRW